MTDRIRVSHILLMYEGSERSTATRSEKEAQEQILDLQQQLTGGAEFDGLAQTHSDCPSGRQGGDLGHFGRGAMVEAFETAAFGLGVGDSSDVVETPFGYHLIHRTE